MKLSTILESVTKTVSFLGGCRARADKKLAELDKGVLGVALLLAALDGTILPEEYAAFVTLVKSCRGYSAKNAQACLDKSLQKAGYLMAIAQVGCYSEKARIDTFVQLAGEMLPDGFIDGSVADIRRAFVLWVAMGVADGAFSALERKAIDALKQRFGEIRFARAQAATAYMGAMSPTFRLAYGSQAPAQKKVAFIEDDFMDKAAALCHQLAVPAKRAKAEAALNELATRVASVDANGQSVRTLAQDIKLH